MLMYTTALDFSSEVTSLILVTTAYGSDFRRQCDYLLRTGKA